MVMTTTTDIIRQTLAAAKLPIAGNYTVATGGRTGFTSVSIRRTTRGGFRIGSTNDRPGSVCVEVSAKTDKQEERLTALVPTVLDLLANAGLDCSLMFAGYAPGNAPEGATPFGVRVAYSVAD